MFTRGYHNRTPVLQSAPRCPALSSASHGFAFLPSLVTAKKPGPSPQLPEKKTVKSVLPLLPKEPWLIEVVLSIYSLIYVLIYVIYIYTYYIYNTHIYIYMSNYIPVVPPLWLMSSNNWKISLPLPHCELPWLSFQNGQAVGTSNQIHKKLGHSCIPQLFQS